MIPGSAGVDIALCGEQYVPAIYEFSRIFHGPNQKIQRIYFVEYDKKKLERLRIVFDRLFPISEEDIPIINKELSEVNLLYTREASDQVGGRLSTLSVNSSDTECTLEQAHVQIGRCHLHIEQGDIRKTKNVEVIVSPEITTVSNGGTVATGIKYMVRKDFRIETLKRMEQTGSVEITEIKHPIYEGKASPKYVFHVSIARWKADSDSRAIKNTFDRIFEKRRQLDIPLVNPAKGIALPLLGIGEHSTYLNMKHF